jgi:hypothetical protein
MANLQLTQKGTICHVSMIFATVNFDFYVIADIFSGITQNSAAGGSPSAATTG